MVTKYQTIHLLSMKYLWLVYMYIGYLIKDIFKITRLFIYYHVIVDDFSQWVNSGLFIALC